MNDLVSILIPNYNKASFLRATLSSILTQTYSNWECIIVDDCSSDNTIHVVSSLVQRDNRFIVVKLKP